MPPWPLPQQLPIHRRHRLLQRSTSGHRHNGHHSCQRQGCRRHAVLTPRPSLAVAAATVVTARVPAGMPPLPLPLPPPRHRRHCCRHGLLHHSPRHCHCRCHHGHRRDGGRPQQSPPPLPRLSPPKQLSPQPRLSRLLPPRLSPPRLPLPSWWLPPQSASQRPLPRMPLLVVATVLPVVVATVTVATAANAMVAATADRCHGCRGHSRHGIRHAPLRHGCCQPLPARLLPSRLKAQPPLPSPRQQPHCRGATTSKAAAPRSSRRLPRGGRPTGVSRPSSRERTPSGQLQRRNPPSSRHPPSKGQSKCTPSAEGPQGRPLGSIQPRAAERLLSTGHPGCLVHRRQHACRVPSAECRVPSAECREPSSSLTAVRRNASLAAGLRSASAAAGPAEHLLGRGTPSERERSGCCDLAGTSTEQPRHQHRPPRPIPGRPAPKAESPAASVRPTGGRESRERRPPRQQPPCDCERAITWTPPPYPPHSGKPEAPPRKTHRCLAKSRGGTGQQ